MAAPKPVVRDRGAAIVSETYIKDSCPMNGPEKAIRKKERFILTVLFMVVVVYASASLFPK
jgi:hypothetical protein